jgi:PKD repeat protein
MAIPGIYRISLTVTDVKGRSGSTEWTYHQSAGSHIAEPIENIEDRTVHLGEKIMLGPESPPTYLKSMRWTWSVIHAPTDAIINTENKSQYIFTPTQAGNYLLRLTVTNETGADLIQQTVRVSVVSESRFTLAQKSAKQPEPPKERPTAVAYAGKDQLHCFTPTQTIINLDGSKSSQLTDGSATANWSLTNPDLAKYVTILNPDQLNAQAIVRKPGRYEFRLSIFEDKSLADEDQSIIQLLPPKLRLPAFKGEWPPDITQSSLPEWYGTIVARAFDAELLKLRPLAPQTLISFQHNSLVPEKKFFVSYQLIYGGTPIDPKNISIPKATLQTFWGWFDLPKEYHEYPKKLRVKYSVTQDTENGPNKFTHEIEPIPQTILPKSIPINVAVDRIYITEKMRLAGQDLAEFSSSQISN